jgi:hypothetical protein
MQTRVYDEVLGQWLNVTKNYTVEGNWTRTVLDSVTISGIGQATDSAISPDGKFFYVVSFLHHDLKCLAHITKLKIKQVTGYFSSVTHFGGYTCTSTNNNCLLNEGYLTTFKRDPSDGSLLWKATQR